jgi:hypothetical protein
MSALHAFAVLGAAGGLDDDMLAGLHQGVARVKIINLSDLLKPDSDNCSQW